MGELGAGSVTGVMRILSDRSESPERRESAAAVLGGLRCREAVEPLIDALAEGEQKLSWTCMTALTNIGSRRMARRLIEIVRGGYPVAARQETIHTLWRLQEVRAEQVFIWVAGSIETEEEYTRDMATEALGNTCERAASQPALATRLFDPSVSIRYAALCAKLDDNRVIANLATTVLANWKAIRPEPR